MIILLSYIFYFLAASVSPLQRRWLAKNKPQDDKGQIQFAFLVSIITSVLALVLLFFEPFTISGPVNKIILLALLSGVSSAYFWIASYMAQKGVEAGVSSLLSNIYTPITIILAWIFLNEGLTLNQVIGTGLLLLSIVLISNKHRVSRFKFDKYFWLMLSSGAVLALTLLTERALQKTTGFAAGTMISWWSQSFFLGLATLFTKSRTPYNTKDILTTGVLRFLQMLSWVTLIFFVGNLSLVSAITTFKIVIIFFAAALFLNERDQLPRKVVGSIIAVIGLLLMK